jgi:hypothetical protein
MVTCWTFKMCKYIAQYFLLSICLNKIKLKNKKLGKIEKIYSALFIINKKINFYKSYSDK